MIELSVCIVTWNNESLLRDCLSSVYGTLRDLIFEVIVVDNGSTDGTVSLLTKEFTRCIVICNEHNLGFTVAFNQAFEAATGKYLLILNNDTVLRPGSVQMLLEYAKQHPSAGAVGCRLMLPDGSIQKSCHHFPNQRTQLFNALFLNLLAGRIRAFGQSNMTY